MRFKVGIKERDAWLACMSAALKSVPELAPHIPVLELYFADFATFLMNSP
jgi:truncated hemoglobin YjbI